MLVSPTAITSSMTEQTDPYAWKPRTPLSDRLVVHEATERSKRATPTRRPGGITGGLAALDVNYTKPVKHLRADQKKGKQFTEGVEADSQADIDWEESIENPGEFGLDGQEKHFMQLLYQDHLDNGEEAESNFF